MADKFMEGNNESMNNKMLFNIIYISLNNISSAMKELKDKTFASILELDTKSKIEIYRILKRHAENEQTIEWFDQVLTRLKNNQDIVAV
ncbi:MAG: hypothetical protein ACON47_00080 [Flavobacteriaceae bacterium]